MSDMGPGDVLAAFEALPLPTRSTGLTFAVGALDGFGTALLGKSPDGDPAVLLPAATRGHHQPNLELQHVSMLFDAQCHVMGAEEGTSYFHVIRCHGDPTLTRYFLLMSHGLLSAVAHPATESSLEAVLGAFVELFRAATKPPIRSSRGLWGELLLIAESKSPEFMVRSWHDAADERFDFGSGQSRVEVKTSTRGTRLHHFSLEQLTAPALDVWIASIQVEGAAAGVSVMDLVDEIRDRIEAPELVARLLRITAQTLGADWDAFEGARFDRTLAVTSLRLYPVGSVPIIALPVPSSVTRVEFVSDLGSSPEVDEADVAAWPLLQAVVPRNSRFRLA